MRIFSLNRSALLFSLRATVASLVALSIAFALGLESPQWAAITTWIVVQPTRGKTFSKGLYRFLGTFVGALFGIFLIKFFDKDPIVFVLLLSLWVGGMALLANLVQYFQSYGAILAGFTASLVSLLVFSHPDQVMQIAQARIFCIFLGIAVVLVFASFLSRSRAKDELFFKIDQLMVQILQWTEGVFLRKPRKDLLDGEKDLITQITLLEELATYAATESMQVRRQRRDLQSLLAQFFASISAIRALGLHLRTHPELIEQTTEERKQIASDLQDLSQQFGQKKQKGEVIFSHLAKLGSFFQGAIETQPSMDVKVLKDRYQNLLVTFKKLFDQYQSLQAGGASSEKRQTSIHRDLRHAQIVGLRTTLSVLIVGLIWILTKWSLGPWVLMLTAVNCSIFATSTNPKSQLRVAFRASLISLAAAFLCLQILSWLPQNLFLMLFVLALFLLPAGIYIPNPTHALAGTLFGANFLVFAGPSYPMRAFHLESFLHLGIAFFAAMILTYLSFYLILPEDPSQRSRNMILDIVRDMERMAKAPTGNRAFEWETLMYNRVGGLIKVLAETGEVKHRILEGSFAIIDMGQEILRFQDRSRSLVRTEVEKNAIAEALKILGSVSQNPQSAALQMQTLSKESSAQTPELAHVFHELSERLLAHQEFLRGS